MTNHGGDEVTYEASQAQMRSSLGQNFRNESNLLSSTKEAITASLDRRINHQEEILKRTSGKFKPEGLK